MDRMTNYIDGSFTEPIAGRHLQVIEPATGRVYAEAPASDHEDVGHAVAAARKAFPAWSATPAQERSRLLIELAQRIDANLERLAKAECVDTGKPISLARTVDIPRAATNFRFFATAILHASSEAHETDDSPGDRALNYTQRRPRGVAGLISPWNLPLYLLTWKIAPALATGNTAVCKPSELTPATATILADLADEVGIPPGVLNIVHGTGPDAGAAIVAHADVPTISFTGGTETGRAIASVAGPMFKRLSLELGGKNPNLVFADADQDEAAELACRAAFTNQGQICLCGSRVLVEEPAYEGFVDRLVARARELTIGDPLDEETRIGSLISHQHMEKVRGWIERAREVGGEILCGGGAPRDLPERCANGWFLEPTVIAGLPAGCDVERQEIFGPVVTVSAFADEDEAIERANDTRYGLAAMVCTSDLNRAHRVSEGLEAGIVWVNCWMVRDLRTPFGGMKQSGVGREGGAEALRFFTEPKNVCVRLGAID